MRALSISWDPNDWDFSRWLKANTQNESTLAGEQVFNAEANIMPFGRAYNNGPKNRTQESGFTCIDSCVCFLTLSLRDSR